MITTGDALHRPPCRAALAFVASLAAACGNSGESGAADGEGGASIGGTTAGSTTTGSTATTTTGSSSGEGGAPAATGGTSSGGGGAEAIGSGGTGGGAAACDGALAGMPCDVEGASCEEIVGQGLCPEGLPRITSCTGGRWEQWTAISCETFAPIRGCDLVGDWLVAPSGPFDGSADWLAEQHGEPFTFGLDVRDDGRLYASAAIGWFDPDGCTVSAHWTLDASCDEEDGEQLCSTIERDLDVSMLDAPAVGTVELSCWGECGGSVTAPVTASRP
jgi:hypothetical protein